MTDTLDPATTTDDLPIRRPNENPYLAGNLAPVTEEVTAFDLPTTARSRSTRGSVAAQRPEPRGRRRSVQASLVPGRGHGPRGSAARRERRVVSQPLRRRRRGPCRRVFGANTNVGGFAGTTWAMVEGGSPPVELGYELDSRGPNRFNGTLDGPFTAHPKYDPTTGELHSMNYHWPDLIDHVNYTVVGGDGRVTKNLAIPVNDMPMMHDMSLTESTPSSTTCRSRSTSTCSARDRISVQVGRRSRGPRRTAPPRRHRRRHHLVRCRPVLRVPSPQCLRRRRRHGRRRRLPVRRDHGRRSIGPFGDNLSTFDRWVIDPVARRVTESRLDDRPRSFRATTPRSGCNGIATGTPPRSSARRRQHPRCDHQDRHRDRLDRVATSSGTAAVAPSPCSSRRRTEPPRTPAGS